MSSDAGWAQAGCLFAAPGSLIGAAVGFFAAAKLGIPLEGIDLLIGLFVGASLAYLGGGMAATLTMMVIGMLGPLRNYKELFSYSAWLVGSVATGVLLILAYNRVWP